jgi:hypothetical protein
MKKEQMQSIIDAQAATIASLKNSLRNLELACKNDVKNAKYEVEDKFYEQWKQMNGKFIKRFIAEMIQTGELNFSFRDNWIDHFTMTIDMDGNDLASYMK